MLAVPSTAAAQAAAGAPASGEAKAVAQDEASASADTETSHDEERRTMRKLPVNFGRGVVGVFSLDNLAPFLGGVVATGLAHQVDGDLAFTATESGLNEIGHAFGNPLLVGGAAIGLFAAGRIAEGPTFSNMSYDVLVATGVNFLYTEALKLAVDRTRPDGSNDKSFPSGHSSNAFTWATVLKHHYGWKAGVPAYFVASFVAVTRVDRKSHFFSDVVAGAALGFIIGRSITRVNGLPIDGPQLSVMPIVGPSGQRGLALRIVY